MSKFEMSPHRGKSVVLIFRPDLRRKTQVGRCFPFISAIWCLLLLKQ